MNYHFRIYYLTSDRLIIHKIKDKFRTTVSVNGESFIRTNEHGKILLEETERRGFIKIREYKEIVI